MPRATPFHERMKDHCWSYRWKEWAGKYAVCSYDTCHEREYYALRHSAGLIDVSPLYKYEVSGKDAAAFLSRITVKDITKLKVGQVTYLCWCDDQGKVLDDGTVTRLDEDYYRVTAAEPCLYWFSQFLRGFPHVKIEDSTESIAALSIQGPKSREILKQVFDGDLDGLRYFRALSTKLEGRSEVVITRTGYTGDLGYEVWIDSKKALKLWDLLIEKGRPYGVEPCGLDAMDVTRIEAGYIMNGVDYFSANRCLIESRKSSPYEIGLGWTVKLDRDPFVGQQALKAEKDRGAAYKTVGLETNWDELEREFSRYDLPPQLPHAPWRDPRPVYEASGTQVGFATSGTWSPTLKKNIALATLKTEFAHEGKELRMEQTIEFQRKTIGAYVRRLPFLDLERKRTTIDQSSSSKTKATEGAWQKPKEQEANLMMQSS